MHGTLRPGARVGPLLAGLLGTLALAACGGSREHRGEAPAQNAAAPAASDSSVGVRRDTLAPQGVAGSGTAAVGGTSGSIGTPGAGPLHSGDPSDAAARQAIALINASEVEMAKLAVSKSQSPVVRGYAQTMISAHQNDAAPSPAASVTSGGSDLLVPLQDARRKTAAALRATPAGAAFDRAYIDSQVASHEAALQTLGRFETAVRDNALTDQIRTMKAAVQRHLEDARRVQTSLGGAT